MTDQELERRLRAWYRAEIHDGEAAPAELALRVATIPRARPTPQHSLRNRRNLTLLAAAVLTTGLIGGSIAVGSGVVRQTSVVPPSPSPDASLAPPPFSFTGRFDSALHGISMDYPTGWETRPATEPWNNDALAFGDPGVDVIFDPTLQDDLYFALVSEPLDGRSADDWVAGVDVCSDVEGGSSGGSYRLDGAKGFAMMRTRDGDDPAGCQSVAVATATRGYVIRLHVGDERQAEGYGWGWFEAVLETVDLRQEDSVDATVLPPPSPESTPTPPSEAEVAARLNGFLEARVAGEGAQQYLDVPEADIPLLYATTAGAPYERAEFEPVLGYEWPYSVAAFKVRLFAGDTVVEQLVFVSQEDRGKGLDYVPDGFGTDIAPTTEDGRPVPAPYSAFDGEVTLRVVHPWVSRYGTGRIRLIPEGPGVWPTTDAGERAVWDYFVLIADPVVATSCQGGPSPADAEALAESIRSHPDLEATAPAAVIAKGAKGLMMDVVATSSTKICGGGVPTFLVDQGAEMQLLGTPTRLYLFDAPEGSSMRTLAIAIVAPESHFERAVQAAAPTVESIEFHAP